MKKIYVLVVLLPILSFAQNITFADPNFKAVLLTASPENGIAMDINQNFIAIDTNADGEIQFAEALNVYHLLIGGSNISSLSGIAHFTNLVTLDCQQNQLTTMDFSGLGNLVDLTCSYNQLTSLDVSALPNLQYLFCNDNMLNALNVSGCFQMVHLDFGYNSISAVDVAGMSNLNEIIGNDNGLTSLNLNNFANLEYVDVSYNSLTSLQLQGCDNLVYLSCAANMLPALDLSGCHPEIAELDSNQIASLIIKNGYDDSEAYIQYADNPLVYLCADESEIDIYEEINDFYGYDTEVNTYCSFTPGGTFYQVIGNNTFDLSGDGCDTNDIAYPNMKFSITGTNGSGTYIANGTGSYNIALPAGTYTITPIFEEPAYFQASPNNIAVTFPADISPFNQPFCLVADGIHPDLEVVIVPVDAAVPGFDAEYRILLHNKGNQIMAGTLTLTFPADVMQLLTSEPEAIASGNMLSWDFSEINPTTTSEYSLMFHVNAPTDTPPVNMDDPLTFTAEVETTATDEFPDDNQHTLYDAAVSSFDPNDSLCLNGPAISPMQVGDFVYYRIRFENTSNFPATNIVVKNMIDSSKLDVASLSAMESSHNYTTRIDGTQVEFIFENINLPFDDANNNGYVVYKIRTNNSLVPGNTFANTAAIYFDYNFPIQTNTDITTVQALAVSDFEFGDHFRLYPNPAGNMLNIAASGGIEMQSVSIYNTLGQLVVAIPDASYLSAIDVSSLRRGQYVIRIVTTSGTTASQFVKQ